MGRPRKGEFCTVEGCGRPYFSTGLCLAHYRRKERGQDLSAPIQLRGMEVVAVTTQLPKEYCDFYTQIAAEQDSSRNEFTRRVLMDFADAAIKDPSLIPELPKVLTKREGRARKPTSSK